MSAAPSGGSRETAKAIVPDSSSSNVPKDSQKASAPLEEDDEFEDFPVDGWCPPDTIRDVPYFAASLYVDGG